MGNRISCSTCNPKPLASNRVSRDTSHSLRRDGHVLRLWAEVFHVSASSGAVRWTQLSDDLVPVTVTQVQNRFHVTAYNSRVDKVLDTWLAATRLGQASNCFVYWKDGVSGDTWGLNFTSAADARAFRECISAARDFRRAESSYSLRERARPHSQPTSPSRRQTQSQCTCDCMTADALHRARNGRIRYSTFARQDSSGQQSSKSDGSLVRRQAERQQYFASRGHVRSMEDQMRAKCQRMQSTTVRRPDDKRQQPTTAQLRSKSTEDVRRVATTATTTDDLITTTASTTANQVSSEALKRMLRDVTTNTQSPTAHDNNRPKSLSEVTSNDRSRSHRSLEGRRRSLERSQCVDLTDASPPTPRRKEESLLLDEYETELRRRLATPRDDAIDAFETLLKESMDDVATLMREVQHELTLIRAEERRFKSLSTQSLLARSSAPILDTLSIDGQLPFLAHSTSHSALTAPLESLSIASMMTSSEVSDDEKASLTTAISDDDDLERDTPSAAAFECLGAVRKSGFLSVKKWLLRKRHALELARKRGWKGYWVSLKGATLLFYNCESREGHAIATQPKHLIFVENCLLQSIPEHPKRDHVFCLSTAFGDAYLLDAPCLEERDSWIHAIHCACASQLSRSKGRLSVSHALNEDINRLERAAEQESRSRHETELLLTCSQEESKQRQSLVTAVMLSEEKCERHRVDAFRLKCYLSAVENCDEMPNPKTLLSLTSRRTKSQLNRLGVFTVSSLHAFTCAKNPCLVGSLLRKQKSEEKPDFNPFLREDLAKDIDVNLVTTQDKRRVRVSTDWTAEQVLAHVILSQSREYFLSQSGNAVSRGQTIGCCDTSQAFDIIPKALFNVDLSRDSNEVLFGFSVESELVGDDLCVFVSRVEGSSIAFSHGLRKGDELVVINGALVHDLDMMFVESVLQEELTLCLMIRSSRAEQPQSEPQDDIEALVCPPPPQEDNILLANETLETMIVPKVDNFLPKSCHSSVSQIIHFPLEKNQILDKKQSKVVKELLDTECAYVRALEQLLTNYLEPLSRETSLLSQSDVRILFGSIQEIIEEQRRFQSELESVVSVTTGDDTPDVGAIADVFVRFAPAFRQYSTFCASHSRAVKLLADEKSPQSQQLREWLSRRSSGQLAQSLESYLIKPIQRVLKYPLLLSQMRALCSEESSEGRRLSSALRAVESVAEHINDMQRIHEEYGAIFEHLSRTHQRTSGVTIDLTPPSLLHYGGVEWNNALEFIGKNCRKGVELHSMCFVFNSCVVFLCKETIRARQRRRQDVEIVRHQTLIPVIEVQVRASHSDTERDFRWELIQLKTSQGKRCEKIYRLSNSSNDYRNAFLRTIRQIIREDVRQMKPKTREEQQHANSLVSCGLCGKDVQIGERQREISESPVWKRRQNSETQSEAK